MTRSPDIARENPAPFLLGEGWLRLAATAPPIYQCGFDVRAYEDQWFQRLTVDLPDCLAGAVPKRRAEYLAGRHAARMALSTLGLANVTIRTASDRSPCWPSATLGSITHTHDHAMSCVGIAAQLQGLGIDAEYLISKSVVAEIYSSIVNAAELRRISALGIPFEAAFTLTFSAKESLYKALYPQIGKFFDYLAAELVSVDVREQSFVLCLREDLSLHWRRSSLIGGHYRLGELGVLTQIALARPALS
jgi:4'-phosphopantetheinyl transferase EntD